jgi:type II secretion system protein N
VRKKLPFIVLAAIPVLSWMLWIVFPESSIQTIIEDSVADSPFLLEVHGLSKGFFYTMAIDELVVKSREQKLGELKDIRGRINPLFLPLLQLHMALKGSVGSGNVSGTLNFARNRTTGELEFGSIELGELSFLQFAGIKGKGTVSGMISLKEGNGHAEFVSNDAVFDQAEFSGVRVPLNIFHKVTGSLDVRGNTIEIVSLSLQGKDIHARLKGKIRDGVMDISMELMPGKSYVENPFVLAGLESFKISPGYYMIPLKRIASEFPVGLSRG